MDVINILIMVVENLYFPDSISIPMSTNRMGKSFELTYKKGFYNHFFNTVNNYVYKESHPEPKYHGAD